MRGVVSDQWKKFFTRRIRQIRRIMKRKTSVGGLWGTALGFYFLVAIVWFTGELVVRAAIALQFVLRWLWLAWAAMMIKMKEILWLGLN